MPNKKAAYKALRHDKKMRTNNLGVKNNLRRLAVAFRKSIAKKDKAKAQEIIKKYLKALDKAAQHGYIKKNNASRKKSRAMKKLNALVKS